ncbi:organic cation transporter protein-like [Daphnia pulex]|uniref:organic cation transporter protein-like n=1 Tax=Daphnia pulex TaxID=6669 RepID=UPI001EE0EB32|nr:organic cation transporter protein-like [Daphnia pulex]
MAGKFNYGGVDNPAWINDEDETNKQREQQQQHHRHHGKVGPTLSSPRPLRIVDRAGSLSRIVQHKKLSPTSSSSVASSGGVTLDDDGDDPVVDFDDMLPYVGEFGPYQIALFFLTAPFCFFLAFSYFSQVFITLVDVHTCHIPQLNRSGLNITQKREISIPLVTNSVLGGPATYDSCTAYDVDYESVLRDGLRPNATWPTRPCRDGWDYDLEQIRYHSAVTENNWVCDEAGKAPLAQALFFCGSIIGGIVLGYIADRFGRIPALILCNLTGALAGIITTFSTTFGLFAFSRFLMGIAFDNSFTLMYILVLEYVGPTYRTLVANLSIALFYTAGTTVLPWIAWGISDWRMFSLATSIPMASVILAYWIVPESARWLLSQGQTERAISILKTFARINKKQVDESVYKKLKTATEEAMEASSKEPQQTVLDLLRTPRMRRNTILLTLLWVLVAVVYDGHARNTANLGLSVFLTFSVASVTELPADLVLVFFLDKWGRRILAFGSLLGASVFSLATLAVPNDQAVLTAVLAIIGRFCVNITFNIGLQYGAELIPTSVRAQGIAYVHIAGYVAAIVSPYIVDLARFSQFLPLTILGILALIGAIVGLMLPETLGAILPETIEDGENFGKDQSFWDFPCCQRQKEIEPDTVTASSGDSMPVVAAKDSNFIRAPSNRANALRTSIRGEAFRSSLLARQRQQRQLDPNDKSHKTNNPETIISSSSAPPPRPPID